MWFYRPWFEIEASKFQKLSFKIEIFIGTFVRDFPQKVQVRDFQKIRKTHIWKKNDRHFQFSKMCEIGKLLTKNLQISGKSSRLGINYFQWSETFSVVYFRTWLVYKKIDFSRHHEMFLKFPWWIGACRTKMNKTKPPALWKSASRCT